jgi:pilus assembly protein CpaC
VALPEPLVDEPEEVVKGPAAEINLVVGRSKLIDTKRVYPQILVANPAIADVQLVDRENPQLLNLYGIRFGTTTLTLLNPAQRDQTRQFMIRVTIDDQDLERRLATLFPGSQVTIEQAGSQVILEGQVPDSKMMAEILQLVESELAGSQAAAEAGMGSGPLPPAPETQQPAAQPAAGAASGESAPTTIVVGGEGGAAGAPSAGPGGLGSVLTRGGGGGILPGTIINRVHIPGPRQILLKVKIAELNRTALREVGVNWQRITAGDNIQSNIGGVSRLPEPGPQLIGLFDNNSFNLYINALRQNNLVKILSEPNLVALDGQPARFQSGGSFPYPVPQANSAGIGAVITIQFRDFGALLEFIPTILANDVIRLDVSPTFSQLDEAFGISVAGGIRVPGIRERRARTVVEMREGQTLAIAGLLQTLTEAEAQRVPLLGDIPIFGTAFSRNRIRTSETELIVLVTPVLVAPAESTEIPAAPGDKVIEPNDLEFYFLGRLEGKTGHPHRATVHYLDPFDIMKHFRSEDQWVIGPHGHADH